VFRAPRKVLCVQLDAAWFSSHSTRVYESVIVRDSLHTCTLGGTDSSVRGRHPSPTPRQCASRTRNSADFYLPAEFGLDPLNGEVRVYTRTNRNVPRLAMGLRATDTAHDLGDALHAAVHARPVDPQSPEGSAREISSAWLDHRLPQLPAQPDMGVSLYIRTLHTSLASAVRSTGWNGSTTLSRAIVSELLWWRRNVRYNTPFDFRARDPQSILTTDACKTGWGAELVFGGRPFLSYGPFWTEDDLTSSNQRETRAMLRALLYFRPMIIASNIRAIAQ
jgi:hypothetical protein